MRRIGRVPERQLCIESRMLTTAAILGVQLARSSMIKGSFGIVVRAMNNHLGPSHDRLSKYVV